MMLIARHAHTKEYMDANLARLNDEYVCPGCGELVCLKKAKSR
jgi:competence protein CoiA